MWNFGGELLGIFFFHIFDVENRDREQLSLLINTVRRNS